MDDSHTSTNMCDFLKAMADKWRIEKHALVLVTNNASNMSLAAELGSFLLTVKHYIWNKLKKKKIWYYSYTI